MLASVKGRWWTTLTVLAVLAFALAAWTGGALRANPSSEAGAVVAPSSASAGAATARAVVELSSAVAPASPVAQARRVPACAATAVSACFVPPAPYSTVSQDFGFTTWYGAPGLWTALSPGADGTAVMFGLQQKLAYRSTSFALKEELQPNIAVTATNVTTGEVAAVTAPTNGWVRVDQPFMLVGVQFPGAGCWRVEAQYKGEALAFVVNVLD